MTETRPDGAARRAGIVTGLLGICVALGVIAYEGWQELQRSHEEAVPRNELDQAGQEGELPATRRRKGATPAGPARSELDEESAEIPRTPGAPPAQAQDTVSALSRLISEGALLGPESDELLARLKSSDKARVLAAFRRLDRAQTRERASWVAVAARLPEGAGYELLGEALAQAPAAESAPPQAPTVDVDADPDDDPLLAELLAVDGLAELAAHHPGRKAEVELAYTRALARGVAQPIAERIRKERQNLR